MVISEKEKLLYHKRRIIQIEHELKAIKQIKKLYEKHGMYEGDMKNDWEIRESDLEKELKMHSDNVIYIVVEQKRKDLFG